MTLAFDGSDMELTGFLILAGIGIAILIVIWMIMKIAERREEKPQEKAP